jgi:putative transposase
MNCPHCAVTTTQQRTKKTKLGYTTYFCQRCQRTFNERTGTPFNYFTHETLRNWEARFAPLIADQLRTRRRGQAGASWYVDETYLTRLWKVVLSLSSY